MFLNHPDVLAMTILLAGHETTANAVAFTIYFVAQNSRVLQDILAEAKAVCGEGQEGCLKEGLVVQGQQNKDLQARYLASARSQRLK